MFSLARLITALLVLNKASNPSISSALMLSKKSQYYSPRQESVLQVNHSTDDTSLLLNLSQDCKTPLLVLKPDPQQFLPKPVPQQFLLQHVQQQFLLQPVPQQFLPEPLDTRRNLSGAKHRNLKKAAPGSGLPSLYLPLLNSSQVGFGVPANIDNESVVGPAESILNPLREERDVIEQTGSTSKPSRKRKAERKCSFCEFAKSPSSHYWKRHEKLCQKNPLNLSCQYCKHKFCLKKHKVKHERHDCLQRPEQNQQYKPKYKWLCGRPNTQSVQLVKGQDGSMTHKKCPAMGQSNESYMPHLKKCHPAVWKNKINNALFKPAPAGVMPEENISASGNAGTVIAV